MDIAHEPGRSAIRSFQLQEATPASPSGYLSPYLSPAARSRDTRSAIGGWVANMRVMRSVWSNGLTV